MENYKNKSDDFDVLWLFGELKKAISSINAKVNSRLTTHEAVAVLYKMNQGQHEANDHYLERFKAAVLTVEMEKGRHIFASPELVKSSGSTPSKEDLLREEERSKVILLLKNSDDKRFGSLAKSLKDGSYLSQDEYPITVSVMYKLMVTHLGVLGNQ